MFWVKGLRPIQVIARGLCNGGRAGGPTVPGPVTPLSYVVSLCLTKCGGHVQVVGVDNRHRQGVRARLWLTGRRALQRLLGATLPAWRLSLRQVGLLVRAICQVCRRLCGAIGRGFVGA